MTALIKSHIFVPMKKSTALPVDTFVTLFTALDPNSGLSIKQPRLKALILLTLALVLRPSSVVPEATLLGVSSGTVHSLFFTKHMLLFSVEGVKVTLSGKKNAVQRTQLDRFRSVSAKT